MRHARTDRHVHAKHLAALADFQVDHVQAIARAQRHRALGVFGQFVHQRPGDIAHIEAGEIGVGERQHRRTQ